MTIAGARPAPERLSGPDPSGLLVHGGRRLRGSITTSGFKHSLVTVFAAAAAAQAPVRITNVPDIVETRILSGLLSGNGARVEAEGGSLTVDATGFTGTGVDAALGSRIHGVVYLIPALLRKAGRAVIPGNGGCQIGDGPGRRRPVEQYVSVARRFGATARQRPDGGLEVAAGVLRGTEIDLLDYTADRALKTGPLYSGASKMALLMAAVSEGVSTLRNLYPKPDVTDLVGVLEELGAEIERPEPGTVVLRGRGGADLTRPVEHMLVPDLIEVVTWLCAGTLLAEESLAVRGPGLSRALTALAPEVDALERLGVEFAAGASNLVVHRIEHTRPIELTISSHGVYSDSQPFLVLLSTLADGTSRFTETVWGNRFSYLDLLTALGADVRRDGITAVVTGRRPPSLPGAELHAPDLRGAAVALLAALLVPGPTVLSGTGHLARGYPDLPGALRAAGADIVALPSSGR
ncbi:hypothetical protein [Amycolatopsis sp. cmx-4-61]|uniref:hypothetical protein n=1 Tax=Amycolatopsis sp. cmx-4-61 TaxID=2790937 RepID=UPI00397CC147